MEMSEPAFSDQSLTFVFTEYIPSSNYKKITIKSNNVGTFRRTITNGISHLFCISFHCLVKSMCSGVFQLLSRCNKCYPFLFTTHCILEESWSSWYSMLLDIVYYQITIDQIHNVHFIERGWFSKRIQVISNCKVDVYMSWCSSQSLKLLPYCYEYHNHLKKI